MFESAVYNEGRLIVGKMSEDIEPQSFINGIFWQIDSRNVGEVKAGFLQLYYDDDVVNVLVTENDIRNLSAIKTGIGVNSAAFRTALVLRHPEVVRLAKIHQALARTHGFEVEIFDSLEAGFAWLGCDNPRPDFIK